MVGVVPVQECGFGEEGGGDAGAHEKDTGAGDGGWHCGVGFGELDLALCGEGVTMAAGEVDKSPWRISVAGPNLEEWPRGLVARIMWHR